MTFSTIIDGLNHVVYGAATTFTIILTVNVINNVVPEDFLYQLTQYLSS